MSWWFLYGVGVGNMYVRARHFLQHLWLAPPPDLLLFLLAYLAGLLWPPLVLALLGYRLVAWLRGRRD